MFRQEDTAALPFNLPLELLFQISLHLSLKDFAAVALVGHNFNAFINRQDFWKNNLIALSPSLFETLSKQINVDYKTVYQNLVGFTARDFELLCENEHYHFSNSKSKKVGHAVIIKNNEGQEIAIQYLIPTEDNGKAPKVVRLTDIEKITRLNMTRYKAKALGATMYATRYLHAKIGNNEIEHEIDIAFFSESDDGKEPFWGSKKKKIELNFVQNEIGLRIKGGEELFVDHESIRARDADKVRKPSPNVVMGQTARNAYEEFYDEMSNELPDDLSEALQRSFRADLINAYSRNFRPEWIHIPLQEDNFGAAPKWSKTEMMVLERIVKWFALNRPGSFISIKPIFEMFFASEIIKHIHFEATVQEKGNWIHFIQDINPFEKWPLFRNTSDIAQATAIAYKILNNMESIYEQIISNENNKINELSIENNSIKKNQSEMRGSSTGMSSRFNLFSKKPFDQVKQDSSDELECVTKKPRYFY